MRALVLSGGGVRGAYQAGVIRALAKAGYDYDIFCGVSVGALNAAFLHNRPVEGDQFHNRSNDLVGLWYGLTQDRVYRRWWPFGRLHGLWKSSIYDSSPLIDWVYRHIKTQPLPTKTMLRIGAVSLTSGRYKIFDENYSDQAGAVLASSSFPGLFCPIELEGELWSDGGVREITPLKSAIEAGATDIDVILCSPPSPQTDPLFASTKKPTTLDIAVRAIDLMSDEILSDDLERALLINRLAELDQAPDGYRKLNLRIFRPSQALGVKDSMVFDHEVIRRLINLGWDDTDLALGTVGSGPRSV